MKVLIYQTSESLGPQEPVPQIFSPANLNLEKEKNSLYSYFHHVLQAETQETDVVRTLTFYQSFQDLSAVPAMEQKMSSQSRAPHWAPDYWGGKIFLSFLIGSLVGLVTKF